MPNPVSERIADTFRSLSECDAFEVNHAWVKWSSVEAIASRIVAILDDSSASGPAKIGLLGRNRIEAASAFLGILMRGDCIVTINPFQARDAAQEEIARLDLSVLIAEPADIEAFGLVYVASRCSLPLISLGQYGQTLAHHVPGTPEQARHATADCAFLIGTSGTSGTPKRIPIRYDTLYESITETRTINAEFGEDDLPNNQQPPLIQYSPLAHITGSLAISRAGIDGRRLVLLEKFTAPEWIRAVRTYRHRIAGLPPAMMKMVLNESPAKSDLESVISIWSGSAPVDAAVVSEFETRYDVHVLGNYGATEYCGVIANDRLAERLKHGEAKRSAVGRLRRHVSDFRIVDVETGEEIDGPGVLEVRVHRVGPDWIRTSDIASIDEDDYLYIHGRADDAIIRGGFKIVPDIISDALKQHEAVDDAFALGLPDARLGQVPAAVVQLRKGRDVSADALISFAREKLIAYQAPKYIRIVDQLPRTPSMKFDKRKMLGLFGDDAIVAKMAGE